jgi:hypothetical protein
VQNSTIRRLTQAFENVRSGATVRCLTALAMCGIAVVGVGCSFSISLGGDTKTVDHAAEVSHAKKILDGLSGLPAAYAIDCPFDVEAKVGTTYECQVTLSNGQEVSMPFRVTSVNGDRVEVDQRPDLVDQALALSIVYKSADTAPKSVDCPTDVPAKVGKTFDCRLALKDGSRDTVAFKVEKANSTDQNLRIVAARQG